MAVKLLNIQRGSSKLPSTQKQPNEANFTEQNIYEIIKGHPGFPQVYWTGVQDGYYAIVMELLGTDLYELLRFCDCKFGLQVVTQYLYVNLSLSLSRYALLPTQVLKIRAWASLLQSLLF